MWLLYNKQLFWSSYTAYLRRSLFINTGRLQPINKAAVGNARGDDADKIIPCDETLSRRVRSPRAALRHRLPLTYAPRAPYQIGKTIFFIFILKSAGQFYTTTTYAVSSNDGGRCEYYSNVFGSYRWIWRNGTFDLPLCSERGHKSGLPMDSFPVPS